jgi:hypothetical protein
MSFSEKEQPQKAPRNEVVQASVDYGSFHFAIRSVRTMGTATGRAAFVRQTSPRTLFPIPSGYRDPNDGLDLGENVASSNI